MNQQNTQSSRKPSMDNMITSLLPPANPIIIKSVGIEQKVSFRLDMLTKQENQNVYRPTDRPKEVKEQDRKRDAGKVKKLHDRLTLTNGYEPQTLQFMKFDNQRINRRGKMEFFSSLFIAFDSRHAPRLPQYKGKIFDDQLQFDSNFQSANLMAVYKIDTNTYDLILQNDINTKAFTQWYNFKVHNKRHNFVARFNIVNLYKTKSLYNMGMKPIVRSERSDRNKRIWRRKGFSIYYQKNQLSYQDNQKKFYKTLSFQYDFSVENDVVQFAHCIPYDLSDLKKLMENIKVNPKVGITSIGTTIMGRSIPMITISADNGNRLPKKALILLGRQHPGETPGSFVCEEMVLELLKNSKQVQFLLWRFDIYVFPMVNIDGVVLGNYRGNFAGYDLNRCWLKPDPSRQPEVFLIKNMIRKIAKRQPIQLVVDLHGHSRKMGSFFYGNQYGSNHMLFPYIASKMNRNILFQKSKFTHETQSDTKFSTARVVLGNLVKDNGGYVYTYEVSFFGYYKENSENPFSFNQEHYKELGKALVISIYRTYLEIYKEQKTLKQSVYLRTVKGEIRVISEHEKENDSQSGSDSQAAEEMKEEILAIQQFIEENKQISEMGIVSTQKDQKEKDKQKQRSNKPKKSMFAQEIISKVERVLSKQSGPSSNKQFKETGVPVERYNFEMKKKIEDLIDRNMENDFKLLIAERLPLLDRRHLKSQKFEQGEQISDKNIKNSSSLAQKSPQKSYLDYMKLRKQQRECEGSLKISGATFQVHGRKQISSPSPIKGPTSGRHSSKLNNQVDMNNFNYMSSPYQKIEKSCQRGTKSYHTIDMNGYMSLSREENDLVSQKPYFQKRKISSKQYLVKGQGEERSGLGQISKSGFHVNRLQIKTPQNLVQNLPDITPHLSKKQRNRVKLPNL